jgi:large subunit ribosomal protein L24
MARKHKIMKGDRVKVIRGNYRELEGAVLEVLTDSDRVRVEGVNMRKRHTRPSQQNPDGGIISFEAPIDISNVMLIDPASDLREERQSGSEAQIRGPIRISQRELEP